MLVHIVAERSLGLRSITIRLVVLSKVSRGNLVQLGLQVRQE